MESEDVLRYYLDEVKNTQHDINDLVAEEHILDESEQATDFLLKADLANLNQIYHEGKEITENVVNHSIRQKHLTEKQAQTVRSRVATLNKTLRSRQTRRKHRHDIRDVTWNIENSSTGTRSRSATPDSLDSEDNPNSHNEDLTSDEDQQLSSLPPFPLEHTSHSTKTKIKWTSSEPLQSKKFTKYDNKGDIAHLGSENVVLKGYQPLTENGSLPRPQRERSGSDPTTEVHLKPLKTQNFDAPNLHTQLTRSQNSIVVTQNTNNCSSVYLNGEPDKPCINENLSFEGLIKQNENNSKTVDTSAKSFELEDGVPIEELSDSEIQYLKPLLYVEIVAILDQYKLSYHKKKASNKSKGGNVFRVNLSTLIMRDMPKPTDTSMVPQVFRTIVDQLNARCLEEDGILRLAGQKQKLESLCAEIESKFYNNRRHVELLLRQATVHELTGVLKKLLRDLPDPLFTMELFDMFYQTSAIKVHEDQVKALNLLVLMLPIEHRNTVKLLLDFLHNIIKHENKNRMGLHNVAMIAAPSFFPALLLVPKDNRKFLDKQQFTRDDICKHIRGAADCCHVIETMLRTGEKIFTVPSYLANQAREAQRKAQVRKDIGKDKERKIRSGKTKLARSATHYEPGAIGIPRIKKDLLV